MKYILLLLTLCSCSNAPLMKRMKQFDDRVSVEHIPELNGIGYFKNRRGMGSGFLVSRNIVLTAAHVAAKLRKNDLFNVKHLDQKYSYKIKNIYIPKSRKRHCEDSRFAKGHCVVQDKGIIVLKSDVDENINPLNLTLSWRKLYKGKNIRVTRAGYGNYEYKKEAELILKASKRDCLAVIRKLNEQDILSTNCMTFPGDSGSPILIKERPGLYYAIGITATAVDFLKVFKDVDDAHMEKYLAQLENKKVEQLPIVNGSILIDKQLVGNIQELSQKKK